MTRPTGPSDTAAAPRGAPAPSTAAAVLPDGGLRVLVAEDSRTSQMIIVRMLQQAGHRPDIAGNGHEAIAALSHATYSLVLMDCHMPQMDGFEASRAIRLSEAGTGRHVPIVALTGNALDGDRERCLEAGMDDYLPKPITRQTLAETLERWGRPRRG